MHAHNCIFRNVANTSNIKYALTEPKSERTVQKVPTVMANTLIYLQNAFAESVSYIRKYFRSRPRVLSY